jgi:hypothetical protein
LAWLHNTARRDATEFFGALKFCGELAPIGAGWAARDAAMIVAGVQSGILPGPVIGHRPLDGKEPLIVVGNDEEELPGQLDVGRGWIFHDPEVRRGHVGAPVGNGLAADGSLAVLTMAGVYHGSYIR